MPTVDQFQSVFMAAVRSPFVYEPPTLAQVLVVADLAGAEAAVFADRIKAFAGGHGASAEWQVAGVDESRTVEQLLGLVERSNADLVVSYRNVHTDAWQWPHSLGRHLDILTQATDVPVLVVPHPSDTGSFGESARSPRHVMAVTGHLAGDSMLVNHAAAFAAADGKLSLAHVEDDATFERYMDTIAKIPAIDTDTARTTILAQLLKDPRDYVDSVRAGLATAGSGLTVEAVIETGHRVGHYRHLVESRDVELLVLHTKDDGQDAMHGVAYPLAVELRSVPLLML